MPFGETIVALATPAGESAIALVRASGPLCQELTQKIFSLNHEPKPRSAALGNYKSIDNNNLDHCIYTFFKDKHSYTGEAMLELSLHGNPLIVQNVIEDLIHRGCRMAEPGEFTKTAFTNGKLDLSQAEAVSDLIKARSDKAIRSAQQQLGGALGKKIEELTDRLLQIIAEVEAYIDFPEEDLPPEDEKGPASKLARLSAELARLIETAHYSALLKEGIKTVIVGPPNAGKSSLLNILTGEERAIVSPEPGTTRDFIAERIMVGPYCINIMDTAGLHPSDSPLEKLGMEKTMEKLKEADFFLVVFDSTSPAPQLPQPALNLLKPDRTLVIENKIDLDGSHPISTLLPDCPRTRISMKSGEGLDGFRTLLVKTLEQDKVIPSEDALIVGTRHATALAAAKEALDTACEKMRQGDTTELMASDLRLGLEHFGDVVGKIDNESMLDKLFASFCIGK